jgi:hypothetical protein
MPAMEPISKLPNRRDIDGLRALSVLCVFLYHLEVPPFSGGFVGVDIFNQVRILFPDRYLCDADCPTTEDGLWLYWDVDHLTVAGARRVGSMADGVIRKFIEDGDEIARRP